MKNTRNKIRLKRKIRGTCGRCRDSAARGPKTDFRTNVRSRKIRGTWDGTGAHDAKSSRMDIWTDTKHRNGFTIVELLVALAISAILLGAIAAAFNGSIINYRQNENIFRTINKARQALYRITTQLRTADAVDPCTPDNQCSMITADGEDITYSYNNADNKLYLITNDDTTDSDYVLCDNVTAMTFTKESVFEGIQWEVKSVQISITVVSGDLQRTISSAAVIRRNLY
jgi:prepilin-type N-terminal cleavage/methylation domain-containing protein